MADTSPHDADHQRGRHGTPRQMADCRRETSGVADARELSGVR